MTKEELKAMSHEERLIKACEILEANDVELPIEIGRFGIYYQYEMSGSKVSYDLNLDSVFEEQEIELSQEVEKEVLDLLSFLTESYVKKRFTDEGQNSLVLDQDGELDTWDFSI